MTAVEDANGVLERISGDNIDLCLLDINLPGKDGLTVTREIRAKFDIGIILVTGKDNQIDRIVGLESGADDYITKPFDPRELLSRVKNLLRRIQTQEKQKEKATPGSLKAGHWTLTKGNSRLLKVSSSHYPPESSNC